MQESTLGRPPDDEYQIRLCGAEDVPSVIQVNSLALPEHYTDDFYYQILRTYPETFFLAERDGAVIGYIMCRTEHGLSLLRRFGLAKKCHVISIAVMEGHRGKGVGTRLIQRALERVRADSAKECYLEVRITNDRAIALYKRLGFRVVSTLSGYYKDGESAYTMAMSL
jgi:[ribosomal protein S18]-alanine N-acetyltransferase